mgnify:CR=1 FL=1
MITITLMGQLQTTDGERDLACELPTPVTVRQVIQRQGRGLRHMLQLLREKKVLVTINKRIASEDSMVQDGDAVRFVGHDGAGGSDGAAVGVVDGAVAVVGGAVSADCSVAAAGGAWLPGAGDEEAEQGEERPAGAQAQPGRGPTT